MNPQQPRRTVAMPRLLRLATFAILAGSCILPKQTKAAVDAPTVSRAIDRGVAYLRGIQTETGGWNEYAGHSCGLSALCTLALLNAGVSREDDAIKNAMLYLRATETSQTYSVALQTLVFCQYGSASDMPRIRNNVTKLVQGQKPNGSWGYGDRGMSRGDPSNSQFALLALGAAQDHGVQVDPKVFRAAIEYWKRLQNPDGGWSYSGGGSTGSMTCAGVASLIIAQGRLGDTSSRIEDGQIVCCGGEIGEDDPIQQGLEWLARRFIVEDNPNGHASTYFYYLYAIERTGRLSGRRFFGGHDWYREGAEKLLSIQDGFQGFWSGGDWEPEAIATSFSLLFLSKGKRQVVVGQLAYQDNQREQWQPHPDSLRQLVRHVERAWGRDLTWQTVRLKDAGVVDVLQTPVLVISGRESLNLSDEQSDLLKEYIDQGGTILFDASGDLGCGNATNFQNSVANLCSRWYPDAPLERLPTTHPVFNAERQVDIDAMPTNFWVYGVQACCRTAVFYVPQSLTCRWELSDKLFSRGDPDNPLRRQIDHSVRIGQNIIAYATGRELKDKLDAQIVLQSESLSEAARGSTRIASLAIGAGGADARRALPNVATIIRNQAQIDIAVPDSEVGFESLDLANVDLLWVHGRREFTLSPKQRDALSEFINNGGVILGTAICGDEGFADSFRTQINQVLGQTKLASMPADHPMLTRQYLGYDIRSVTIRRPSRAGRGMPVRKQVGPPMLEYAELDGFVAVVFSPLDLSCALESQNSVQCPGYKTEDAAKIVTNVLQMTLHQ
ncbi:DUF4159 domain-containing protein [Rhodopirellula sp. MGV]|uniref:DUF4159 domain-containing protein n=1 Tax=Rhodopirellula sp. MGV TaxID=2023130 RepID=UPI000B966FA3|nr:DUF4159 domain-containing protein [Rhodopirellula sp. MGV]OYP36963.1 hypothetical protein CGZ80_06255 [Rhodopirellula sp. MGV]PNY36275.1 DUF4159 domain-containing protein [Rhodopirellula baltica]